MIKVFVIALPIAMETELIIVLIMELPTANPETVIAVLSPDDMTVELTKRGSHYHGS